VTRGPANLQAVTEVLETVEALEPRASGALLFEQAGAGVGVVLVDRGRICWASVARSGTRLRQLLAYFGQDDTPRLLAKQMGSDLRDGLGLVGLLEQRCAIDGPNLRKALRQHTAEAITQIPAGSVAHWLAHRDGGYGASFTFGLAELLAAIGTLGQPGLASSTRFHLQQVLHAAGTGLAYMRTGGAPTLVGAVRADALGLAEIGRIGRSAAELLDVTRVVDPERRTVARLLDAHRAFIAWEHREAVCVSHGISAKTLALHLAALTTTLERIRPTLSPPMPSYAPAAPATPDTAGTTPAGTAKASASDHALAP
jgi:hypothetical protein